MVDSDIFGVYTLPTSARVMCLSCFTARIIDLRCPRGIILGRPLRGLFSRNWWAVAKATKFRTVIQCHPVIKLNMAKEYLK